MMHKRGIEGNRKINVDCCQRHARNQNSVRSDETKIANIVAVYASIGLIFGTYGELQNRFWAKIFGVKIGFEVKIIYRTAAPQPTAMSQQKWRCLATTPPATCLPPATCFPTATCSPTATTWNSIIYEVLYINLG